MLGAERGERLHERHGRVDEAALAEHELDDDRRDVARADVVQDELAQLPHGPRRDVGRGRAISIRERGAIDLGAERREALAITDLAGHRHREVRPAVERVLEDHDALPLRVGPRDLDGVLDGLGAAIGEERLLREAPGSEPIQSLRELDVALVRHDVEARVQEPLGLRLARRGRRPRAYARGSSRQCPTRNRANDCRRRPRARPRALGTRRWACREMARARRPPAATP